MGAIRKMFGLPLLLTTALAAVSASASYLPPTAAEPHFMQHLTKRQSNGTAFHGPYNTQGRDIVNSRGEAVTWAGVNWPMSGTQSHVFGYDTC